MKVVWSTRERQMLIEEHVRHVRFLTLLAVTSLSVLFLLLAHLFALRPLHQTHKRMSSAIAGQKVEKNPMPWYVGNELKALDASVNVLEANLRNRDVREKELEEARQAADVANQSKSEFLANMSHEIRTPMNGVIGMADLLQNTKLTADQKLYSDTILSSAGALLSIINDILDFSKAEAGKFNLDPSPFNLRHMCEDVLNMLSVTAAQKGVEVVFRYHPSVPEGILADSVRLRQIVTNIAGNAVKFTSEGHVCVEVNTKIHNDETMVVFTISDTGIGIPQDQMSKIFRAFEQVDGTDTREYEGTGLGLAISAHLVELMKGQINAKSTPGVGTEFEIVFPLQPAEIPPENNAPETMSLSKRRILVVDDLPVNLHILHEQLSNWDANVTLASSGQEALKIIEKEKRVALPFDIIILDYQMPGMTGIDVAQKLRETTAHMGAPLVVLSSADKTVPAHLRKTLGIADVVQKPIRAAMLNRTIWRALHPVSEPVQNAQKAEPVVKSKAISRVLVAEDNKTNCLVVKSMLKDSSMSAEFAENGLRAVEQYKAAPPDIILMDMSMPVMNGIEAAKNIRNWENLNGKTRCPIIALTANARRVDRDRCLKAGMDDFLAKPISKSALLDVCKRWT